jgi:hypothetical protein
MTPSSSMSGEEFAYATLMERSDSDKGIITMNDFGHEQVNGKGIMRVVDDFQEILIVPQLDSEGVNDMNRRDHRDLGSAECQRTVIRRISEPRLGPVSRAGSSGFGRIASVLDRWAPK